MQSCSPSPFLSPRPRKHLVPVITAPVIKTAVAAAARAALVQRQRLRA